MSSWRLNVSARASQKFFQSVGVARRSRSIRRRVKDTVCVECGEELVACCKWSEWVRVVTIGGIAGITRPSVPRRLQAANSKTNKKWANVHETRDSISLIPHAGCLGLSPVISTKIHSEYASLKSHYGVQGHSMSSMLVPPERTSAVLVMTLSKSVSICNRSHARRTNKGEITIS